MAKLDELMENEEFVSKVESSENEEAVKAVYAEYGLETNETDEINPEQLENVTGGGAVTLAVLSTAVGLGWKVGSSAGILIRAYYDMKKYGDPYRSYSKKKVDSILRALNLI